ncbi:MAG: radical SAM family heme chaperone HemW [Candidatus Omnitrophica bacterium]|nr:radical SAM family heme chaperone HemW [Candidatus Omnitrophota bacterium]
MRGLYIHIPFCKTRCHYCNFVTTAEHSADLRERFFKALSAEIKHACEHAGSLLFDTLYLGGGTPSGLSIPELKRLVEEVRGTFEFKNGYEFTCEFNPGDGDETKLRALRELGVNRISLGCQSFQDTILQRLGRRYTVRNIVETVEKIRRTGISNISFDLMLRLPGQTVEDFRNSVRECIGLKASQVSLYDLEVHEETPFGQFQKEGKLDLPSEEDHARMYESAIEMLTGAGYEHYEISNFAKPGLASRHNLIYWHNQEYLGLGPGAFTYLNGIRSQFAPDLKRYLEKSEVADWKNDIEDKLSEEEKETETLVTGLRLCEGVALASFPKIYPALQKRFKMLCADGLMEIFGERVSLTSRGKFLSEDVFASLLEKDKDSRGTLL